MKFVKITDFLKPLTHQNRVLRGRLDNPIFLGILITLFCSVLALPNALASSTGITGYSGKDASNCNSCHTGSDYQSTLTFQGNTTFIPGSTNDLTLLLSFTQPTDFSDTHAGINVAISDDGGQLLRGDTTKDANGELTHIAPQATSGSFTWQFQWRAPNTEGEVTLYACSEAVNRDFSNSNDDNDVACITQTLTIEAETPPEEPEPPVTTSTFADIDNDGRADFAFWRPANQTFYTKSTATGNIVHREVMGQSSDDEPLLGDIDGNGKSDLITWDSFSGIWNVTLDNGSTQTFTLGQTGDYPFALDRDGDGKDDPMVRRPSNGTWYYLASSEGYTQKQFAYGVRATDVPVPGYYDNDNRVDFAIWRDGVWYMRWSSDNITRTQPLGTQSTDIMAPADYDGDGMTDVAMWRPATGRWYIYYSSGIYPEGGTRFERNFGLQSTDIPVPADYDGDGKADLAIRRASSEEFIYLSSATGDIIRTTFGREDTDVPVLGAWQLKDAMLNPADENGTGITRKHRGDVNGDGRSDFISWRPSNQTMSVLSANDESALLEETLGSNNTNIPLEGHLDSDELADFASWDPVTGVWSVRFDDGTTGSYTLGQPGDIPFLLDRDGDGMDDFVVRRPSDGTWYYLASGSDYELQSFAYGRLDTDLPVPGYYDDDNQVDFAIWRDGTWYMRWSSDNVTRTQPLGTQSTDIMVPEDYDGDGITDVAIWRPATGTWYIYYSTGVYPSGGNRFERVFGKQSTDIPIPADYDGDGKADLAVRRPTSLEFIYLSSASGQVIRVSHADAADDIPVLAAWKVKQPLIQTEMSNGSGGDGSGDGGTDADAAEYYNNNISQGTVQSRCITCHVSGGAADGLARLIFEPSSTPNYQTLNQQAFMDFLALDGVDADYILTKASGGNGHVGGTQLPIGSDEYNAMSTWLALVTDSTPGNNNGAGDYWDSVSLLSPSQTLRRAAVILNGNLPSDTVTTALGSGTDAELREAVMQLMQGEGFRQFLLRGANDRLLTDKWIDRFPEVLEPNVPYFPEIVRVFAEDNSENAEQAWTWWQGLRYGMARAPAELLAYIVENDRPYTEVVTADYTMLNRFTNEGYAGTASFNGTESVTQFQPGNITGAMIMDDGFDAEYDEEAQRLVILSEGTRINWPHTGVLSELAWLSRYPSTATNRNRARSRWTYFHFLDFDIEKSAARTQDPVALADTNNPTLNNPNCTVCHQTLDPVAGAYQFLGNEGWYKDKYGGMDSLPPTYKEAMDSPYQRGDTWYRTMLAPGFEGIDAPTDTDSLQWLGQQIAGDPRFARSAIKFWWHSLMGSAPLDAPNDTSDATYIATYNAQSAFINQLAQSLESHWNMKQSMADMMISPWFRAMADNNNSLHKTIGIERLLTPEELFQKTRYLTGLIWLPDYNEEQYDADNFGGLTDPFGYNMMYGGIDSDGVTARAEEMTSVMSQVAITHATELACPVVMTDFAKADADRLLFDGIDKNIDVLAIASQSFEVQGKWYEQRQRYQLSFDTTGTNYTFNLIYNNPYGDDENNHWVNLVIDHLSIMDQSGNTVLEVSGADAPLAGSFNQDCGEAFPNEAEPENQPSDLQIWDSCPLSIPIQIDTSGTYTVSVDAYYVEWKPDNITDAPPPQMTVSINSLDANTIDNTGMQQIRNKIVQLYDRLLGEQVTADSTEVDIAAGLFVDSIIAKAQRTDGRELWEEGIICSFDHNLLDDPNTEEHEGELAAQDPYSNLTGWRTVMAFLLSDYKYLHE